MAVVMVGSQGWGGGVSEVATVSEGGVIVVIVVMVVMVLRVGESRQGGGIQTWRE